MTAAEDAAGGGLLRELAERVAALEEAGRAPARWAFGSGWVGLVTQSLDDHARRLGRIEARLDRIETRLEGLEERLGSIEGHLSEISGQLAGIIARLEPGR